MSMNWLSSVTNISVLISSLGDLVKKNRATKDMLLRELKLNLKAFETAQKSKKIDNDKLLSLLENEKIKQARESSFRFKTIKAGNIQEKHIADKRNKKYIGKDCQWLFKNTSLTPLLPNKEIEELSKKSYDQILDEIDNYGESHSKTMLYKRLIELDNK
ncbi:hypothetical protein [Lutibacter citreus]|uniref:hypothetical protein n=1 Tax=Lutibacter citreus TaxID=2138210 RepID=UPI0013002564|nr:hypothetical protein [Lutibacter citreus]